MFVHSGMSFHYPEIRLSGARVVQHRESTLRLEVSGALSTILENPGGSYFILAPYGTESGFTSGRTHNRIRSPR